jgi:hypothetical protein
MVAQLDIYIYIYRYIMEYVVQNPLISSLTQRFIPQQSTLEGRP